MTTPELNNNPLVNCLQQALYPGKSGAPPANSTGGTEGAASSSADDSEPSGWWSFQQDPSEPAQLTMLVSLITNQAGQTNPAYYSSRLSMSEMQSLYQWLALQMNQPKADSDN
ncbi:MAG: hypothetical protein PVF13_05965 [Chromatiales bacterium]